MADIVKSMMEETGMSVIDLLMASIEIAHRDYPSELARHRDQITQGLYGGVECLECTDMGKAQVASTGAPVAERETQNSAIDHGKAKLSGLPDVVVKGNSDQEQLIERRPPLRVVIRLRKKKNLSVEATERPKSDENCETKAIETTMARETSIRKSYKMDQFQNLSREATERPKSDENSETKAIETSIIKSSKMNQFKEVVQKNQDFTKKRFENAKRKLQENYAAHSHAKKQRSVKMLSMNELLKQGTHMPQHKSATSARSRIASRLDQWSKDHMRIW